MSLALLALVCRIGEASHPGPIHDLDTAEGFGGWACEGDASCYAPSAGGSADGDSEADLPPLIDDCDTDHGDDRQLAVEDASPSDAGSDADPFVPCDLDMDQAWQANGTLEPWQVKQWEEAERALRVAKFRGSPRRPRTHPSCPTPAGADFQAATAFEGSRAGYYFGTGERGTGYYNDAKPQLPERAKLCLDELVPLSVCTPALLDAEVPAAAFDGRRGRRARRARRPDGKRVKRPNRNRKAAKAYGDQRLNPPECPPIGTPWGAMVAGPGAVCA